MPLIPEPTLQPSASAPTTFRPARRLPALCFTIAACAVGVTGCDRVKEALHPVEWRDPQWVGDSTLLASKPEFLFRVKRTNGDVRLVPLTTVGSQGFRPLYFSSRGWRAFDLQYLQRGSRLIAYNEGRPAGEAELLRGMWEPPSSPLDTVEGCNSLVPAAKVAVSDGISLVTNTKRPPLKPVTPLGSGELQAALSTVSSLIAPTAGVSGSMLAKYQREVHVVNSATSSSPTIVIEYNDPEVVPDSMAAISPRPRQLIVVLDRGVYGYRPTFRYATVGNKKALPRLTYLDYLDVDDDGRAELFFGLQKPPHPLYAMYTIAYKFENETWREILRYDAFRCQ